MARRTRRPSPTDPEKDKIKGAQLINFLNEVAETGKYRGNEVSPERITAARAALPFLRPTLASVEQTVIDEAATTSPEAMLSLLQGLSERYPSLAPLITAIAEEMRAETQQDAPGEGVDAPASQPVDDERATH